MNRQLFALAFLGLAALASSDEAPGCPDVPSGACSICGEGQCVGNPDAIIDFSQFGVAGIDPVSCGTFQLQGFAGGIALDECALLPLIVGSICGCGTTGIPGGGDPLVPDQEIPCDFGPGALTNFYGKEIPRICIDVPLTDGSTDTVERCYYAYVPTSCGAAAEEVPLVVDIHGLTSCPLRSSTYTGWRQKAEEECFVVVWPSGEPVENSGVLTSCWNVPGFAQDVTFGQPGGNSVTTGPCCCLDSVGQPLQGGGPDDPLFIKTIIDDALDKFAIKDDSIDAIDSAGLTLDSSKVYLAGHSNGCVAGLATAALYPESISALACHAGLLATPFPPEYTNVPVPIWLVHGVEDLIISYNGSSEPVPGLGEIGFWSIPQVTEYLAGKNGCSSVSETPVFDEDGNEVGVSVKNTDCVNDATVEVVSLTDSGHLPFKTPYPEIPSFGGSPTTVDTTSLAWEFMNGGPATAPPTNSPTGVPTKEGAVCLDILLTNDDGYETLFINTLFEYIRDRTCHNVIMVAPKEGQSGKGTSTDFFTPGLEDGNPSEGIYFLDGTPSTTMYFALDVICQELGFEPDLIVSGPNEGWNIGLGGIPSGTIAAAQAAMVRGNPAIAVSASLFEGDNPVAASQVARLTVKFMEEKLIDGDDGSLLIGSGEGFNVNIPNVFDLTAVPPQLAASNLDDYEFRLTKIGLAVPLGAPRYFRDLADSPIAIQFAGGALNGLPGLSAQAVYFENGLYPLDSDPDSEGNAIGQVISPEFVPLPTFVVTVSPIEFTLQVEPSKRVEKAFKPKKPKKTRKPKKTKKPKKEKSDKSSSSSSDDTPPTNEDDDTPPPPAEDDDTPPPPAEDDDTAPVAAPVSVPGGNRPPSAAVDDD